jgi:hypothetical protein
MPCTENSTLRWPDWSDWPGDNDAMETSRIYINRVFVQNCPNVL